MTASTRVVLDATYLSSEQAKAIGGHIAICKIMHLGPYQMSETAGPPIASGHPGQEQGTQPPLPIFHTQYTTPAQHISDNEASDQRQLSALALSLLAQTPAQGQSHDAHSPFDHAETMPTFGHFSVAERADHSD
ncbi:hypothetical protein Cob_v003094 [Colletotrichum orbiculare MAFF 240422]|uniref:Uncharacterized protein n=1 Tax=Colletotrichum orbiculare (strain 104-T / ATCC 96160 / CBS 514.97 / LARS 414 / MAFF 240422) TaxID=1213857 RepID=A0A484G0B1_COLOR|nr:hypothetical protein Cob_v003094 [Colletotrichum orbiculare MAFF 240422]